MFEKPKVLTPAQMEEIRTKDFFDMILPGSVKFLSDHYVVGDSYRSVWVIREYPPSTGEQAILSQLADRSGVTLRIYHRLVESMEQRKIIQNATRRNKLKSGGNDVNDTIEAEGNLQDVIELLANLRKNKEPLLHCSVFIELKARSMVVFGVKGLMDTNKRLKDAMLFNILSFMSNQLLGQGKTAASIDELYLFLTNMTAIEYIRNAMKRVRKKDSSIILASQNIEDFLIPSIREFTKPLFSIPTHQFLFNAGQINPKEYMDALQVEPSEFELIKYPERGTCLFRCGNERYLLQVIAPDYKAALFGKAGGR